MSDIERFTGDRPSAIARRGGRAISRNQVIAKVRVSSIDADTDVTIAKIENTTMATGSAMRAVLQVCQAQEAMEKLAPAASGRLAYLADDHALGMGELTADLRRDLRRR